MTAVTDTRKRSRDEDSCDFMPISKRINNLTLTSQGFSENDSSTVHCTTTDYLMATNNPNLQQSNHYVEHNYPNQMAHHTNYHQNYVESNNHFDAFNQSATNVYKTDQEHQHQMQQQQQHANHQSANSLIDNELNNNGIETYRPELTPNENPFYYNKNKLLFDLHIERQRRHQTHP